jgi:xylulokinase
VTDNNLSNNNKTYLCFDLGTTRIKSALLDKDGNAIYLDSEKASSYQEGESFLQKPEKYYKVVVKKIKIIGKKHREKLQNVDSLICSSQMAGILSIDRNWEVVMPWTHSLDTRANKYLDKIENRMASEVRSSSGGVPFIAAKIKWIKEDFPKEYKSSHKFINLATYVAGRLAGLPSDEAFIDYSVLAMHGLADVKMGTWNTKIIKDLELDLSKLPEISRPYKVVGTIAKEKFKTLSDIKVLCGIGDQVAGFIGAGILKKGDLVDVAGTYTVLGYATDRFIPDTSYKIISSIYSGIEDIYYHLVVVAVGGYLHSWFVEKFGYDETRIEFPQDTGGLYFIPYIGGRLAPLQPYYKGTFYGLNWEHNLDTIYSAMLECLGYEYDFLLEKIKELNGIKERKPGKIKVIGGGAKNKIWNRLKSDILGLEYIVMENTPFEIIGNYLIARHGENIIKGFRELSFKDIVKVTGKIKPEKKKINYYTKKKDQYRKIVEQIGKVYRELGSE